MDVGLPHKIPDWTFEYHGHKCPFMPLGYMMGEYALSLLKIKKEKDHQTFLFSEMSMEDMNGCFNDGVQASTGCTFGKGLLNLLNYGKLAITIYSPGNGAVRIHARDDFLDELFIHGRDFFGYRKRGSEPSAIPDNIMDELLDKWLLTLPNEEIFEYTFIEDFNYKPVRKSGIRKKCTKCNEYTYEPDLKVSDGTYICKQDYYGIPRNHV